MERKGEEKEEEDKGDRLHGEQKEVGFWDCARGSSFSLWKRGTGRRDLGERRR